MTEQETIQTASAKFYYVYILRCKDANLYTGCTSNLKERFTRHQKGWVEITKDRRPVQLAWCCAFPNKGLAFEFEKY
jgi:putative endonuclease